MVFKQLNFIIQLFTGPRFFLGGGVKQSAQEKLYANPQFQAVLQRQENQQALEASRFNQVGPQGTTTWNGNTQTTALSPEQQRLYDSSTANQNRSSDFIGDMDSQYLNTLKDPLSYGGMYADFAKQQAGDYGDVLKQPISGGDMAQRQRVEDAMMARLNPSLERDEKRLIQSLANQGLSPGGEAYTNAMQDNSRRVNDARLGVIEQGTGEMQATQAMDLARRSQVMGENQGLMGLSQNQQGLSNNIRNQAMSERTGLLQQSGNSEIPAYSGAATQQTPTNIAQMLQQYGTNQNNAQQANKASNNSILSSSMGMLGTLGGSLLGGPFGAVLGGMVGGAAGGGLSSGTKKGLKYSSSDRRLNENIVCVGKPKHGLNLYHFNYIRDPHTRYQGVMADEVKAIMPEAVRTGNDSFMSVDYGMLGLKMKEV